MELNHFNAARVLAYAGIASITRRFTAKIALSLAVFLGLASLGYSVEAQAATGPARIAATFSGTLSVKEGSISATWVNVRSPVASYSISGNRIGVVDNNGTLFVQEGGLNASWVQVATGVKSAQVSNNRIGYLTSSGYLYVKEGSLYAPWVLESSGVSSFALTDKRIGILCGDSLFVKEGSLYAPWVLESTGVSSFALTDTRIGILGGGTLWVKEGSLYATWVLESSGVSSFALTDTRIGILGGGNLWVKEGSLYATWVLESSGVSSFALTDTRIGILTGNTVSVKEGGLYAGWTTVASGANTVKLSDGAVLPVDTHTPIGRLDSASIFTPTRPTTILVTGWALDRDAPTSPIRIHVYVGGPIGTRDVEVYDLLASTIRNDVAAAYPGTGNQHGFDSLIVTNKRGYLPVCVYAINIGSGSTNPLLQGSCQTVYIAPNAPVIDPQAR